MGSGAVWLLAEPTEDQDVGKDVTALMVPGSELGGVGICVIDGQHLRLEQVILKDVRSWTETCQARWDEITRRLRSVLTPRDDMRAAAEPAVDARVLPVVFDEAGRRARRP